MRAVVLEAKQSMRLHDVDEPHPDEDSVLVEPRFVGICGTDIHAYLGEFEERIPYPRILGHEFSAILLEDAGELRAGTPVAVDPVLYCGVCPVCRRGEFNTCSRVRVFGLDTDGALSDIVAVPRNKLYPLPDTLSLREAVMIELYAVAVRCVKRLQLQPAETIVILGAGRLGLSILDVIRSFASCTIVVVDISPCRLDKALSLGADAVVNALQSEPVEEVLRLTSRYGVDRVVEAIGHHQPTRFSKNPMWTAMEMIRPGGRIVVMGQGEQKDEFFWKKFVLKEGSILASRLNRGDYPTALALAGRGLLHPEKIITDEVPLEDTPRMYYELAENPPEQIKVVVNVKG